MTIQKKNVDFEEFDILSEDDFKNKKLSTEIVRVPKIVKTKFTDEQPIIVVKVGINFRTWFANWTSMNKLVDHYGENEEKMLGKKIDLELIEQAINGKMRNVIYLKNSIKKGKKG